MYNVLDRGVNMKEYTKNQVHEVACAFNEHKIIALPTDTVYGVGVKYGNLDDLERLNAQNIVQKRNQSQIDGFKCRTNEASCVSG